MPSVLILARLKKNPTQYCHQSLKRIFRYLRGTSNYGMTYKYGDLLLSCFVDSDYAADTLNRKYLSGFFIKLGGAACTWGAKKQATVSLSTCEAEYRAINQAAKEVIWIKRVLHECDVCLLYTSPSPRDQRGSRMPSSA